MRRQEIYMKYNKIRYAMVSNDRTTRGPICQDTMKHKTCHNKIVYANHRMTHDIINQGTM